MSRPEQQRAADHQPAPQGGDRGWRGAEFVLPVRVYIEDTDAGGIVFYANYLRYLERARTELMRSLGYAQAAAFAPDALFVVRDLSLRYHAPAQLDELLQVSAQLLQVGGATLRMAQCVRRDGALLLQAEVLLACVQRSSGRPQRMPADMRAALGACLASAAAAPRAAD
jgi:4-hydroxybenzoyl-CoA thioesterase